MCGCCLKPEANQLAAGSGLILELKQNKLKLHTVRTAAKQCVTTDSDHLDFYSCSEEYIRSL